MDPIAARYFGTDGIRGPVGGELINPDFIMRLGWAAGKVLAQQTNAPILIGKDTRISGYMLESALEAGLSAAGTNICLLGPLPTPAVAFLTRSVGAQAGIVISASHNPYYDNGIKFFSAAGMKLNKSIELEIEDQISRYKCVDSAQLGKAQRLHDASRRYIEFCKSRYNDGSCRLHGLRIAIDCANGATYHIAPQLFEELGATVICHGITPDGLNINQQCGATNTEALQALVKSSQADLGLALDGDGDRIMMVDHTGELVDGDEILYIISKAKRTVLNGAVVGTVMSNIGLERAISDLGLTFIRAAVGDAHILEVLTQKNLVLGGESSGHIIALDNTTTGDGIIAALLVIKEILATDCPLHTLKKGMEKFPQRTINIHIENTQRWAEKPTIINAVRDAETTLGACGRVLLRESGTEPLLRVTVEGEDAEQVDRLAETLAAEVKNTLAS